MTKTTPATPEHATIEVAKSFRIANPPGGRPELPVIHWVNRYCDECGLKEPHHAKWCQWRES
jgi:hypothetical protein